MEMPCLKSRHVQARRVTVLSLGCCFAAAARYGSTFAVRPEFQCFKLRGAAPQNVKTALDCTSGSQVPRKASRSPLSAPPPIQDLQETASGTFDDMVRQAFLDVAVAGCVGSLLSWSSVGFFAAQGFICGAAAAAGYIFLLVRDVASASQSNGTPLEAGSAWRPLRLLLPIIVAVGLVADPFSAEGLAWPLQLDTEAAIRFYAAMVGFVACLLPLRLRGLFGALPDARAWSNVMPGSLAVAVQMSEQERLKNTVATETPAIPIPILLVSGPPGCDRSALVQSLLEEDPRFGAPRWLSTDTSATVEGVDPVHMEDYEAYMHEGGSAISLKVLDAHHDDEENSDEEAADIDEESEPSTQKKEEPPMKGVTARSIVEVAKKAGACVLDVDSREARELLERDWTATVPTGILDEGEEFRVVSVWVSLPTVDEIVQRRVPLEPTTDPRLLRRSTLSDMEWALTSGHFDFTVINKDRNLACTEIQRAAKYCFSDPF